MEHRHERFVQPGDILTLGRDLEDIALRGYFRKGDAVKVVRIDGHGVLIENRECLLIYTKIEDLFPLGTVFDGETPVEIYEQARRQENLSVARFVVILVTGLIVIAILYSCFPQGLL
jgi:hypothetical protein